MGTIRKVGFLVLFMSLSLLAKIGASLPKTAGKASWYGDREAGKKTANGEIFDPKKDTCASPFYPMNSRLMVFYPKTGKTVIVRVNDRGPFVKGRIIDLSEHAAESVGLKSDGVGYVYITPLTA